MPHPLCTGEEGVERDREKRLPRRMQVETELFLEVHCGYRLKLRSLYVQRLVSPGESLAGETIQRPSQRSKVHKGCGTAHAQMHAVLTLSRKCVPKKTPGSSVFRHVLSELSL